MIRRLTLAVATFLLLGLPTLRAATVTLTFDESFKTAIPGSTVTFTGTVTNTGLDTAFLNGTSFVFPFSLDDTPFFLNFPPTLPVAGSATGALFTVALPAGAPLGLHVGSFSILGGDSASASDILATENFGVQIVPEPGTMMLLTAGVLLFLIRVPRLRAGLKS